MTVTDQIIHSTVRIECITTSNDRICGTGFICHLCENNNGNVPVVITNKHVVDNAAKSVFYMTTTTKEGTPQYGHHVMVPVDNFENHCIKHPSNDVDLAAFPLAPVLNWLRSNGMEPYFKAVSRNLWADSEFMNELSAVEEILMIGYPNELWDSKNNLPIVRRGITATPPYIDFEGKPHFVIDCACFPGSSGSPIYLYNEGTYSQKSGGVVVGTRVKLLGILWGGPQHTAEGNIVVVPIPSASRPIVLSRIPNHLGYCIKASELMYFEEYFKNMLASQRKLSDR